MGKDNEVGSSRTILHKLPLSGKTAKAGMVSNFKHC